MNHCNAVRVPIMMILGPRPPHIPLNPRSLAADPTVAPLALFIYETIVSAGCETIAQNTISRKNIVSKLVAYPEWNNLQQAQLHIF